MKVGDKIPVTIAGQTVVQAELKELGDGKAVLVIPGTIVTMSTRTEIAPDAPTPIDTTGTTTIVDEVVRTPSAPVEVEPVPETTQVVEAPAAEEVSTDASQEEVNG